MKLDRIPGRTAPTRPDGNEFDVAPAPREPLLMRFGDRFIRPLVDKAVARSSRVGNPAIYDPRTFPWIAELEENWDEIAREAAAILQDLDAIPPLAEISPDHRPIAPAGKWRSYFLYGYGYSDAANCRSCPRTTALVERIPGLNSAFFSILVPGTQIPPHTGVTKALLTCHLGIRVPREAERCRMRVADRIVSWRAGEALVFDDTYEHEVANDTDEIRVVLLIQFRRPVDRLGQLVGGLFLWAVKRSRFVQDARRGVRDWTEQRAR